MSRSLELGARIGLDELQTKVIVHLLRWLPVAVGGIVLAVVATGALSELGKTLFWLSPITLVMRTAKSDVSKAIRVTKVLGAIAVFGFIAVTAALPVLQPTTEFTVENLPVTLGVSVVAYTCLAGLGSAVVALVKSLRELHNPSLGGVGR